MLRGIQADEEEEESRVKEEKQSAPRCLLGQTGLQFSVPLVYIIKHTLACSHIPSEHVTAGSTNRHPHLPWLIFLHLPFSPLCPGLNPPANGNGKEQFGMTWKVSGRQPPCLLTPSQAPLPAAAVLSWDRRGGRGGSGEAMGPGSPCFPVT